AIRRSRPRCRLRSLWLRAGDGSHALLTTVAVTSCLLRTLNPDEGVIGRRPAGGSKMFLRSLCVDWTANLNRTIIERIIVIRPELRGLCAVQRFLMPVQSVHARNRSGFGGIIPSPVTTASG